MKFHTLVLPFIVFSSASIAGVEAEADLCLGSCETNAAGNKECVFHVKVDLHASERGYYYFDECEGTNPTLGEYYCMFLSNEHAHAHARHDAGVS